VGKRVRDLIIEQGGTVPEQLPTPKKSFGQLEREEQTRITQSQQQPLFLLVDEQDLRADLGRSSSSHTKAIAWITYSVQAIAFVCDELLSFQTLFPKRSVCHALSPALS
jgi:hypothetical protein